MKTCPRCNNVTIEDDEKFCQPCSKKIVQQAKKIINSNLQNIDQSDELKKVLYFIFNGTLTLITLISFYLFLNSNILIIFLILFLFPVLILSGNIFIRDTSLKNIDVVTIIYVFNGLVIASVIILLVLFDNPFSLISSMFIVLFFLMAMYSGNSYLFNLKKQKIIIIAESY